MLAFWKLEISIKKPVIQKFKSNPKTLGDHIRKKRIENRELQKVIADRLRISEDTITGWENNRTQPMVHFYPAIIEYLGYLPITINRKTLGGKIRHYRYIKGFSRKKLGKLLRVDASTIASWETNKFKPNRIALKRIEKLLLRN